MAPVLKFHFCENENKVISPELVEIESLNPLMDSLRTISLHSLQENFAQTEKQLKLIPYSPSLQISDIKYEIKHSRIKENA
jgi:hypothetical protein